MTCSSADTLRSNIAIPLRIARRIERQDMAEVHLAVPRKFEILPILNQAVIALDPHSRSATARYCSYDVHVTCFGDEAPDDKE